MFSGSDISREMAEQRVMLCELIDAVKNLHRSVKHLQSGLLAQNCLTYNTWPCYISLHCSTIICRFRVFYFLVDAMKETCWQIMEGFIANQLWSNLTGLGEIGGKLGTQKQKPDFLQ